MTDITKTFIELTKLDGNWVSPGQLGSIISKPGVSVFSVHLEDGSIEHQLCLYDNDKPIKFCIVYGYEPVVVAS